MLKCPFHRQRMPFSRSATTSFGISSMARPPGSSRVVPTGGPQCHPAPRFCGRPAHAGVYRQMAPCRFGFGPSKNRENFQGRNPGTGAGR